MRINSKGQITIPLAVREMLGLIPNTEVEFEVAGNTLRIRKRRRRSRLGASLLSKMRGKGSITMSTDQILALTRDGP